MLLEKREVGEKFDASRLASQVVTGIGFLGAGIIIKAAHQEVSGLTTSTGLFAAVCMGLAAGAGFYMGRLGAAIKDTPQFELEVLYNDKENLDMVQRYLKDNRMSIVNLRIQSLRPESGSHYSAEITVRGGRNRDEIIDRIQLMDGINSVIHI